MLKFAPSLYIILESCVIHINIKFLSNLSLLYSIVTPGFSISSVTPFKPEIITLSDSVKVHFAEPLVNKESLST